VVWTSLLDTADREPVRASSGARVHARGKEGSPRDAGTPRLSHCFSLRRSPLSGSVAWRMLMIPAPGGS
jgi:hypothetical protein